MTDKILAEVTGDGMISTTGYMSFQEAEELIMVLPALIVEAKGKCRVRLQLSIAKAEDRITELRKELESIS